MLCRTTLSEHLRRHHDREVGSISLQAQQAFHLSGVGKLQPHLSGKNPLFAIQLNTPVQLSQYCRLPHNRREDGSMNIKRKNNLIPAATYHRNLIFNQQV